MKLPPILKQKNMVRVLHALLPVALAGVYFFGWRIVALLAVSVVCGFCTEWYTQSRKKGKVSYAVFVTAALYSLSLPPTTPFWITAVGIIVAILFGKEVFGGFGKNVFNPAIVGRAFVYVSFPIELTGRFVPVFSGLPGGFGHWSFTSLKQLPAALTQAGLTVADAVTAATPMWSRRDFHYVTDWLQLLLGNIGGVFSFNTAPKVLAAGSIGEVSAIAIACAALYLIATKTAQWRLTVATLLGAAAVTLLLRHGAGIDAVPPLHFTLLSGALLYGAVFMVTDPVSAPKLPLSQWIYGAFIGVMVVFFRYRSIFAGGLGFSILLGNMIAPSLDLWIKRLRGAKKGTAAP
ncbi:MAG: RnfABCDGE type electron transport complex subunit D [Chitinispirillaceae bacterium]|nr:RnfABCDGE type electron transport complex subunit D [Chitinispirillaceae bacterium]